MFLAKFSTSGGFSWVRSFGGNRDDIITDLNISPDNKILLAGDFESDIINFGSSDLIGSAFLVKLNNNGIHLWSKSYT